MGTAVEIEFAVNLPFNDRQQAEFSLLQIRPMAVGLQRLDVVIDDEEIARALCFSSRAMGNGEIKDIADIVYVDLDRFDPARTVEIADEIGRINKMLGHQNRRYLLIGPGRWGSADRWLGIPVSWNEISNVGAIIETTSAKLQADPSQGTHFFHNITSLGIGYFTVSGNDDGFIDWEGLQSLSTETETGFLKHLKLETPLTIKIEGKKSRAVIIQTSSFIR
jgi:hypothetical protein